MTHLHTVSSGLFSKINLKIINNTKKNLVVRDHRGERQRSNYHILYPSSSESNSIKKPSMVRNVTILPKIVKTQAPVYD